MSDLRSLKPVLPILLGAAIMLSLALGIRQSIGIFLTPLTKDLALSVSQFTMAIAVQNVAWGLLQPITGAWATRLGYRPLMLAGALLYVAGLVLLAVAQGVVSVTLGAGVAIGAAMACTGSAFAFAVAARPVPVALPLAQTRRMRRSRTQGCILAQRRRKRRQALERLAWRTRQRS